MIDELLGHHGDRDALPGLVDLAVNVRAGTPPAWLREEIAAADLARYPDQAEALRAVARRHGRRTDEVLLTAGAAEAFVLIARAFAGRSALVVHPQFTEPEVALRVAGHRVERLLLEWPFVLDPRLVDPAAELVVVGNPTNPTSVLHPAAVLRGLRRDDRLVVVDEAFADCVPGEPESLADGDLAGLIVIRSLTKTWGLAGLRVGYVLAAADVIDALRSVQHAWPVSAPALAACVAVSRPAAVAEADAWARKLETDRSGLAAELAALPGVRVVPGGRASFLLLDTGRPGVRERLHDHGFAVRRGETFPGLSGDWVRVAVRDPATNHRFTAALAAVVSEES
ncbi:Rv2231c family pyridoxal phosphate-dependent protein CobC [Jatrophihabitans sp.]|uniref:Rv2231c family pyridoxal phosphate-dependent protein CobC n=1 Tax=Jatrophihabitans sp. TaxID=1932789 RepID=UPI0030C6D660|nr:L-threonine-O-3-phosphate decarboxylase [Jatrophihabitans sp.]